MKRILLTLLCFIIISGAYAQKQSIEAVRDSVFDEILSKVDFIEDLMYEKYEKPCYKLYKTSNIHIFLKLNTANGKIDLVQWSLDSDNEGSSTINNEDLRFLKFGNEINGTFELYPTDNMYQFMLLDTIMGRMWHVQWGFKASERWIRPI